MKIDAFIHRVDGQAALKAMIEPKMISTLVLERI